MFERWCRITVSLLLLLKMLNRKAKKIDKKTVQRMSINISKFDKFKSS